MRYSVRLSGPTGTGIFHDNFIEFLHQRCTPCASGSCIGVSASKLGMPCRKTSVTSNPMGKLGKRTQVSIHRSRVRCFESGRAKEIVGVDIGSRDRGAKNPEPAEGAVHLKDTLSLGTGHVGEQVSSGLFRESHGRALENEISNSQYQRIQDLRFSGDIWEGDSGAEVLDLQTALYWFGYLSKRTELTAYFGPETKRALQQFQIAHGVLGTGAWGSSSRQALWKLLGEEGFLFYGGSSVHRDLQQPDSSLVDKVDVGRADVGIRMSELLYNMGEQSQEFISSISSAPYWRHFPTNVPRNAAMFGLLVGVLVALFGLGYSIVEMFHEQHGQPVRRRILRAHWRDDMTTSCATSANSRRHLDMFPGLDFPVDGEDLKYRLRSKSKPNSMNGSRRSDRLILYEGLVVVGDEAPSSVYPFKNSSPSRRGSGRASQATPMAKDSSIPVDAATDQINYKLASDGSISGSSEGNLQESHLPFKRIGSVHAGIEDPSITRADSDAVASTCRMSSQNLPLRSIPMEQPSEKQPNFVRSLFSVFFTPKGLGNVSGLEKYGRPRNASIAAQLDARSSDKQTLVDFEVESKKSRMEGSSRPGGNGWQDKYEESFKDRVDDLRKAVQAAEKNRQAAMRALAEERQRSLELQVKISRQKETAAALEEEVRVLKESHDALLASLRKKYSSSVAARAAAALLYQNWDAEYEEGSPQTLSY